MTDDELIEWLLDWGRIGEEPVLIEAASRIKKLKAALRKISDVGDEALPSPNLAKEAADLWVCLAMCVDVARKALDDAP